MKRRNFLKLLAASPLSTTKIKNPKKTFDSGCYLCGDIEHELFAIPDSLEQSKEVYEITGVVISTSCPTIMTMEQCQFNSPDFRAIHSKTIKSDVNNFICLKCLTKIVKEQTEC